MKVAAAHPPPIPLARLRVNTQRQYVFNVKAFFHLICRSPRSATCVGTACVGVLFLRRSHPPIKGRTAEKQPSQSRIRSKSRVNASEDAGFINGERRNSIHGAAKSRDFIFSNFGGGGKEICKCAVLLRSSPELNASAFRSVPTRFETGEESASPARAPAVGTFPRKQQQLF